MLRRVFLPVVVALSLGFLPLGAGGCNRAGVAGPASPQPIRDEKEPGESLDTVSAVPDSGSSGVEEMTGSTETEVEVEEDSSAGEDEGESDGDKEGEKSADTDKSDDEDETGDGPDDVDIEIDP